jgi:hypothetical protein
MRRKRSTLWPLEVRALFFCAVTASLTLNFFVDLKDNNVDKLICELGHLRVDTVEEMDAHKSDVLQQQWGPP